VKFEVGAWKMNAEVSAMKHVLFENMMEAEKN